MRESYYVGANVKKKGRENNKFVKYFSFVLRLFHLKMKIRLWRDSGCLLLWRIVAIEAIVGIEAIVAIVGLWWLWVWGKMLFFGKKGEIVICFP